MTTPKRKKLIYDMLSPKIAKRRMERKRAASDESVDFTPVTIDNYKVNKPRVARSLNMQPVIDEPRKLSKTEGMPAVNGQSGERIVRKAVTKVKSRQPSVNMKDAVIQQSSLKGQKDVKKKRRRTTKKRTNKGKED